MASRREFNVDQLVVELDKDRRTIQRAIDNAKLKPVSENERSKFYHIIDVIRALWENETLNLGAEKARLAKMQADKTEIDIKRLNGELIPKVEVEQEASKIATTIKSKMLSLPARMAGTLATVESESRIEDILEKEMRAILEELGN